MMFLSLFRVHFSWCLHYAFTNARCREFVCRAPCHHCLLTSYAMLLPQIMPIPNGGSQKYVGWSRNTETRAAVMSYKTTGLNLHFTLSLQSLP